jgi:hypothetical protein
MRMKFTPLFLFFILTSLRISSQTLHEYFFNNNLTGTNGGPTLTQTLSCGAAAGAFGSQTITTSAGTCSVANVFCFNAGGGVRYDNPSYITNQYSINLFFKFNTLSGYTRIIDFSNSTSDNGVYLLNNCLNFYPSGNVGSCVFVANTYYLMTFVRNGSTGVISVYVNGTLFTTYNDATNAYRPATSTTPIIFFKDDNVVTCEAKAGCVKYASITSATMSAAQVATTWTNICSVVLPIELSSFTAKEKENITQLKWSTMSENNCEKFEIERSSNGFEFLKLGEMKAHGNSKKEMHYTFIDHSPVKSVNYYRLKQVDFSGEFKYSYIVTVNHAQTSKNFYPNPTDGYITIDQKGSQTNVTIKNMLGQEVKSFKEIPADGKLDLSELHQGTYILMIDGIGNRLIISK